MSEGIKIKIHDLIFNQIQGKQDILVKFERINDIAKTTVMENAGQNPEWNEEFQLHQDALLIQVFEKDPLSEDLIGQTKQINIKNVQFGKKTEYKVMAGPKMIAKIRIRVDYGIAQEVEHQQNTLSPYQTMAFSATADPEDKGPQDDDHEQLEIQFGDQEPEQSKESIMLNIPSNSKNIMAQPFAFPNETLSKKPKKKLSRNAFSKTSIERPSGVEKDPATNKNVGKGRRRGKQTKSPKLKNYDSMGSIQQDAAIEDLSQIESQPEINKSQILQNDGSKNNSQTTIRFNKKRRSVQPSSKSRASLLKVSPSQKSQFSLYGLTQHNALGQTDAFATTSRNSKLAKLIPQDATNRFYDKHIIQAIDKYTSQEIHIKNLKEYEKEINKIKSPFSSTTTGNQSFGGIKFNVDEENEIRKMKILRNRLNGKMFHLNEKLGQTYLDNCGLQDRIDEIKVKGTGNYGQTHKGIGKISMKIKSPKVQSPRTGSLNYNYKKAEALKIDHENIRMAQAIIQQKSSLSQQKFNKEWQFNLKKKEIHQRKNGIAVDKLMTSRSRFSQSETKSIIFPEITSRKHKTIQAEREAPNQVDAPEINQYVAMGKANQDSKTKVPRERSPGELDESIDFGQQLKIPGNFKEGIDRQSTSETQKMETKKNQKYKSKERRIKQAEQTNLRTMMFDPAMRHLSGTWMGAFYTQGTNNKKLKNSNRHREDMVGQKKKSSTKKQKAKKVSKISINQKIERAPEIARDGTEMLMHEATSGTKEEDVEHQEVVITRETIEHNLTMEMANK